MPSSDKGLFEDTVKFIAGNAQVIMPVASTISAIFTIASFIYDRIEQNNNREVLKLINEKLQEISSKLDTVLVAIEKLLPRISEEIRVRLNELIKDKLVSIIHHYTINSVGYGDQNYRKTDALRLRESLEDVLNLIFTRLSGENNDGVLAIFPVISMCMIVHQQLMAWSELPVPVRKEYFSLYKRYFETLNLYVASKIKFYADKIESLNKEYEKYRTFLLNGEWKPLKNGSLVDISSVSQQERDGVYGVAVDGMTIIPLTTYWALTGVVSPYNDTWISPRGYHWPNARNLYRIMALRETQGYDHLNDRIIIERRDGHDLQAHEPNWGHFWGDYCAVASDLSAAIDEAERQKNLLLSLSMSVNASLTKAMSWIDNPNAHLPTVESMLSGSSKSVSPIDLNPASHTSPSFYIYLSIQSMILVSPESLTRSDISSPATSTEAGSSNSSRPLYSDIFVDTTHAPLEDVAAQSKDGDKPQGP